MSNGRSLDSAVAAVAAAAAHDLNEDLTIMLSALRLVEEDESIDPELRITANQAKLAGLRCAWKTAGLLRYMRARPSSATMERLIEDSERQP